MKFNKNMLKVVLAVSALFCFQVNAEEGVQFEDPTTGVEIIFSEDGRGWDKIMANAESELQFSDRKGIRQATQKAVMRAKANIAKFFNEKLTSSETMDEITKTLSKNEVSGENSNSSASRESIETMIESITNSADAILKGVIVLEQNVNRKEKYVSVKLGLSRKTMDTANKMNRALSSGGNSHGMGENRDAAGSAANEVRRSRNYDNF